MYDGDSRPDRMCGGAFVASAGTPVEIGNLKYSLSTDGLAGNTATVLGLSNDGKKKAENDGESFVLTIPATVTAGEGDSQKQYKVTAIGDYAFCTYYNPSDTHHENCTNHTANGKITSVIFENSNLVTIGEFAFYICSSINDLTISASVITIEEYAFAGCSGLTSITFAENSELTTLGNEVFNNCSNIESISLPKKVTSVGDNIFYNCTKLKSVTFEGPMPNAEKIAESYGWFGKCSSLTSITANGKGKDGYYIQDNVVFRDYENEKILVRFPEGRTDSYEVPYGVTSISNGAFFNCQLTSVQLPNSLTSIGDSAFQCTGLTGITLPNSLTSIGEFAFKKSGLTSITVPRSVHEIKSGTFNECTNLTKVVLLEGVERIEKQAFSGCTKLETVMIPTTLNFIYEGRDQIRENHYQDIGAFSGCTNITTIVYNGNDINLVKKIVGEGKVASVLKKQEVAPTGLTATAPDNSNQDNGKISGVTSAMEYQEEGAGNWIPCTGTEITGLTAGTYKVRERADATHVASLEATVEVPKGEVPKQVVHYGGSRTQYPTIETPEHGTITLAANGRTAAITPDAGYEITNVTLNGVDKGAVSSLTGLITGDKIEATFQKTKETLDVEAKAAVAALSTMKARSSRTAKGNVKVVAKLSNAEKVKIAELKDLGYTVKYRFYRSTKKSSGYKTMKEGTTGTYINTTGKAGTRYYYKAQIRVYDANGTLVTKTELKNCKYATRKF